MTALGGGKTPSTWRQLNVPISTFNSRKSPEAKEWNIPFISQCKQNQSSHVTDLDSETPRYVPLALTACSLCVTRGICPSSGDLNASMGQEKLHLPHFRVNAKGLTWFIQHLTPGLERLSWNWFPDPKSPQDFNWIQNSWETTKYSYIKFPGWISLMCT